jgi:hypothetical protein
MPDSQEEEFEETSLASFFGGAAAKSLSGRRPKRFVRISASIVTVERAWCQRTLFDVIKQLEVKTKESMLSHFSFQK